MKCYGAGGFRFEVRDDNILDQKIVHEAFPENVYRVTTLNFIRCSTFLDIGANIGVQSVNARYRGAKRVICVEPEPDNFRLLTMNIADNNIEGFETLQAAVSYKYDGKPAHIFAKQGNSTLGAEGTLVETYTLEGIFDKFNLERVGVMKVDVEGAEGDIICGADDRTLAKIDHIALEFDKDVPDLGDLILKLAHYGHVEILGSPRRGGYVYAHRYGLGNEK